MEEKDTRTIIQSGSLYEERIAQVTDAPASFVLLLGQENLIGRQWCVEGDNMVIGRSPLCQIAIDDLSVSSKHAKVEATEEESTITDLGSTNQTLVNGVALSPGVSYTLKNNDLIKMGNIVVKYFAKGNLESVSIGETFDRSYIDALTRVYNKGALALQGMEFYKRALLQNLPFGVASLDLDFFKKVNDTYGHAAGDYVLIEFARLIKEKYRSKDDFIARAGGEEFIVMICRRQYAQALVQLDVLRKAVASHRFEFEGQVIPVTVSIGLSMMTSNDRNWHDVLSRSDQALYLSKENGRNKVSVIR